MASRSFGLRGLTATIPSRACDTVSRWASTAPDAPALLSEATALNYGQLDRLITETAAWLYGLGARPGDRVMLVAENELAVPVLMLSIQKLGAWPCIANARMAATEMAALRTVVQPRLVLVVAGPSREGPAFAAMVGARPVMACVPGQMSLARMDVEQESDPNQIEAAQIGLILFTSGTTGLPKAVMLGHVALESIGKTLAGVRQVHQAGRYDGGAPLSHVMGICTLMSVLHAGASLCLSGRLDIPDLVSRIADGTLTHLSFVPAVYGLILDHMRARGTDLSRARLQYLSCGGATLDPTLKAEVERRFGLYLVNGYGMTECCPIARTRPDRHFDAASIGYAEPGAAVRIVREDGREAARGEVGELWARAAGSMQGYFRNPQATRDALRPGGWMATGDLASQAADGELFIVGRSKDMIIRSGFNVYPAEVEAVINRHPDVFQSAVLGRNVALGEEEVVAFVQPRDGAGLSVAQVERHLRAQLAPYKCPSRILLRPSLPFGTTGKILKRQLLDELPDEPPARHP